VPIVRVQADATTVVGGPLLDVVLVELDVLVVVGRDVVVLLVDVVGREVVVLVLLLVVDVEVVGAGVVLVLVVGGGRICPLQTAQPADCWSVPVGATVQHGSDCAYAGEQPKSRSSSASTTDISHLNIIHLDLS
jgi:hypothetical protein